jgi:antitoxin MazE
MVLPGGATMRISLVNIGNSRGIRLPKTIVEQAQLTDELDLEVAEGAIIIRSARQAREAWEEAAVACHRSGEDRLDDWDATTTRQESRRSPGQDGEARPGCTL